VSRAVWASLALLLSVGSLVAASEPSPSADTGQADYSKRGADTCLKCHDADSKFPVMAIFSTPHGVASDPRSPFAGLQCEACHGPGGAHADIVMPGEERAPIVSFDPESGAGAQEQSAPCLRCHEGDERIHWHSGAHAQRGLACTDCHQIHRADDPVLDQARQQEVCFDCHKKQRAQIHRAWSHPLRFDEMACSDCHAVHGSPAPSLLARPTLNQTCYSCHPEKRGPFLWEHAPVAEDCTLCHRPHGSNHPALLTKRPPWLCQQCHSQAGHTSVARDGSGLPPQGSGRSLLAKGCLNCHSKVHGSNHPSGVKLMR